MQQRSAAASCPRRPRWLGSAPALGSVLPAAPHGRLELPVAGKRRGRPRVEGHGLCRVPGHGALHAGVSACEARAHQALVYDAFDHPPGLWRSRVRWHCDGPGRGPGTRGHSCGAGIQCEVAGLR
eukprot:4191363-Alexandrium_andersonii.AAC.1